MADLKECTGNANQADKIRTKWYKKCIRRVSIGDYVIIANENAARNSWPKGIVTADYRNIDGQIRIVGVKTTSGTLCQPVSKLCAVCTLYLEIKKIEKKHVPNGCYFNVFGSLLNGLKWFIVKQNAKLFGTILHQLSI